MDEASARMDSKVSPILAEGRQAARKEQSMTLWQALRLYPKAVGWSVLLSSTLIMEGYDLALLSSMYASPAFNQKFGEQSASGKWAVPASWQSGLSNGARCGEVIGLLINGLVSERLGYRKTMVCALSTITAVIFLFFFAVNVKMLLVAEILAAAYASEVCPVVLRPYLTTFINMCWVFGQFVAIGVNRACISRDDQWAWRIPFGVQWVWPIPIIIGCLFAPESPWWHVRQGNVEGARRALLRLTSSNDPNFDPEETIAMIQHTNELEKSLSSGTTYWDCFKGTNLRRTEVVCLVWLVQTLCGQNLMGYFAYFCVQAGLPTVQSFNLSLGQYGLGVLGSLSFAPGDNNAAKWAIGVMLIIFTFCYDISVGPVTYSLVSELSSTRLKAKTIVLARCLYNISNIVVNVLTNYQLNSTAWDWGARCAYFWAGTCLASLVWAFFRLPEPKGRTYEELDLLFERGVPARKFATTVVDPYEGEATEVHEAHADKD
ncbi:Major facilitator superfamily domain general substrate transporter [Penicillium expansum]|nr:Major facilitator superfamily domain general substrate transporter [Penicillium expansum]